jgi:hypothetical protein
MFCPSAMITSAQWEQSLDRECSGVKYKRIKSAIHNMGASFLGLTNYWDNGYVVDDLEATHRAGQDIEIDWLTGEMSPESHFEPRVRKSVDYLRSRMTAQLESEAVDVSAIKELRLLWPANSFPRMLAVDDRGIRHESNL